MNVDVLLQAFVFLIAALVAVPIAKRLGLGSVLGYLIAGALIGPFGLRLFGDPEGTMHAAEFGVVIMLFLIGLELQPRVLWRMRTAILGMGAAQVAGSAAAIGVIALLFGLDWRMALAIGLALALSSTAIVMSSLRERGLMETQAGRGSFAVLLFQDIAVIPMLALFPLLATMAPAIVGDAHPAPLETAPGWVRTLATAAAIAAVVLAGRFVLRPVFRIVARTRLSEMFTALALAIVIGVTLLMEAVSLSPALGAFIAGVVLADSEFRHEIETDIEPFRGLLLGLFFVSVGASIDFALLAAAPLSILGLAGLLLIVKAALLFGVAIAFRKKPSDAILIALALAQGGEFAFVLFEFARGAGVLSQEVIAPLTVVVALSMAATPLLLMLADRLSGKLTTPAPERAMGEIENDQPVAIIAGYGRFGQTIGRFLEANGHRVSVLEHDADQVELLRGFGRKVNYGDASRLDLLRAAGAETAKILIVAIDDADRSLAIVETARREFPHLKILARAYDRRAVYELMRRETDEIEREMFEGSLRLGVKALRRLGVDPHAAERAGLMFRKYDHKLLVEMEKHYGGDFSAYQRAVRDRTALFEDLMRHDLDTPATMLRDDAWDTESLDREAKERQEGG